MSSNYNKYFIITTILYRKRWTNTCFELVKFTRFGCIGAPSMTHNMFSFLRTELSQSAKYPSENCRLLSPHYPELRLICASLYLDVTCVTGYTVIPLPRYVRRVECATRFPRIESLRVGVSFSFSKRRHRTLYEKYESG